MPLPLNVAPTKLAGRPADKPAANSAVTVCPTFKLELSTLCLNSCAAFDCEAEVPMVDDANLESSEAKAGSMSFNPVIASPIDLYALPSA